MIKKKKNLFFIMKDNNMSDDALNPSLISYSGLDMRTNLICGVISQYIPILREANHKSQ